MNRGHEVYSLTAAQLDEWKKAAEPVNQGVGRRREEKPEAIRTRS